MGFVAADGAGEECCVAEGKDSGAHSAIRHMACAVFGDGICVMAACATGCFPESIVFRRCVCAHIDDDNCAELAEDEYAHNFLQQRRVSERYLSCRRLEVLMTDTADDILEGLYKRGLKDIQPGKEFTLYLVRCFACKQYRVCKRSRRLVREERLIVLCVHRGNKILIWKCHTDACTARHSK